MEPPRRSAAVPTATPGGREVRRFGGPTAGLLVLLALPAHGAPPSARGRSNNEVGSRRAEAPQSLPRAKPGKPRVCREYLSVRVKLRRGKGQIVGIERGRFSRPTPIYSYWGPFQLQLYAGRRLHDTIRFSFPLSLPVGERTRHNTKLDSEVLRGLSAETVVRTPFDASLTHLVLAGASLDRPVRFSLKRSPKVGGVGKAKPPSRAPKGNPR